MAKSASRFRTIPEWLEKDNCLEEKAELGRLKIETQQLR